MADASKRTYPPHTSVPLCGILKRRTGLALRHREHTTLIASSVIRHSPSRGRIGKAETAWARIEAATGRPHRCMHGTVTYFISWWTCRKNFRHEVRRTCASDGKCLPGHGAGVQARECDHSLFKNGKRRAVVGSKTPSLPEPCSPYPPSFSPPPRTRPSHLPSTSCSRCGLATWLRSAAASLARRCLSRAAPPASASLPCSASAWSAPTSSSPARAEKRPSPRTRRS